MNRSMIRAGLVALSLVSALGLAACKQGVGNRCQVDSDCEEDLLCVRPPGATPLTGGTCESTSGGDMSNAADFAAPVDFSKID